MKHKKLKLIILLFPLLFIVAVPFIGIAAGYFPLERLPGLEVDKIKGVELSSYFSNIYKLVIGIAGVLAVLMIVIAGIEYMSPTPSGKESGKKRAWAALSGLVLALVSYLILQTINPDLLSTNFGLEKVSVAGEVLKVKQPQTNNDTIFFRNITKTRELSDNIGGLQKNISAMKEQLKDTTLSESDKEGILTNIQTLEAQLSKSDAQRVILQENNKDIMKINPFLQVNAELQACENTKCRLDIISVNNETKRIERNVLFDKLNKIDVDSTFLFFGDRSLLNVLRSDCNNSSTEECKTQTAEAKIILEKKLKEKIEAKNTKDIAAYKEAIRIVKEIEFNVSTVL